MQTIRAITLIALIITCYYFVYSLYVGFLHPIPNPGDSWDYHIPIAKSILDGSFLFPTIDPEKTKLFFPGSSEVINALFILFNIPLTVSNVFAIFVLTICCYKFAITFRLQRDYALLFALMFVSLNAVYRWMNAVSIDVWIGIYFISLVMLLEKPQKKMTYFALLGFLAGMLIGSKYNAVVYLLLLFPLYFKRIFAFLSVGKILAFLIPFSFFGLFWYIRNYFLIGNPIYPIPLLGLPGQSDFGGYFSEGYTMLNVAIRHPGDMFNAAFGEYKLWIFSIIIAVGVLINQFIIRKKFIYDATTRLLLIGVINFLFFLGFPTDENTWIMVSSFRYSYPTFIPLILAMFVLATKYKKEHFIGYVAIASMLGVFSTAYYPKLILIYLPVALLIYYFFSKKKSSAF
jgi:hypothetical protein